MYSRGLIASNLVLYSIVHALVDASCAVLVLGGLASLSIDAGTLTTMVILYNVLAFGLQSPLGYLVDRLRIPIVSASAGCLFVTAALFAYSVPLVAVCLAGVGNALFHVGGGVISLNLAPGKASLPGIYVAPGAFGLTVGILLGSRGYFNPWVFSLALVCAAVLIMQVKPPVINYNTDSKAGHKYVGLIILLLSISICIRSLVGLVLNFPWKSNIYLLFVLTAAIVLGKALGGILGDKFGWMRIATAGLIISAPMLAFGAKNPLIAIVGILLFNMTMPVTLVAIVNVLPGRAGFAFGLTTLALIIGAMPTYTSMKGVLAGSWIILAIVIISAGLLFIGLKLYNSSGISNLVKKDVTM
ncbi:MAG: MFS transporter [Clostridiaceae bacterium]|nr:MFS transporter [Clostridiaceae bacterium]